MRKITFRQATIEAQAEEMRRNPRVFLMGQDVSTNMYGATGGLYQEFGKERVRDCPIAEQAMVGAGIGAAMVGCRPIIDLAHCGFIYCSFDQIVHVAAYGHYMYGGQTKVPVTFRASLTYGNGSPTVHGERNYSILMSVPGIKIAVPTTPYDVKGMIKAAVRDDNPTLIYETPLLAQMTGEVPDPEEDYIVPFGKAAVRRIGEDLTYVAIADGVQKGLNVAEALAQEGISVEVIDVRSLAPLDVDTIATSVKKTGRLVIYDPAPITCSASSEISVAVSEQAYDSLKAPIRRLAAPDVPAPFGKEQAAFMWANEQEIAETIKTMCKKYE